ncbi:hypothetical protein PVAP13_4NG197100 [Panicum virgatum]|uniref:Uncharacterized protein n=1 Tax=Panicum virgatum TaxID=38727 RepID=A0A8T0TEE7_PANVG|nr:hypothetical protein PVAP13_4NG197100 [Panicum virgatum]
MKILSESAEFCSGVIGSKHCFGLILVKRPCDAVCNPTTGYA